MKKFTAVLLLAALVTGGCGSSDNKSADTLNFGVTNFADSLEPTDNYFSWALMRYGLGETLTGFDDKMNLRPWLAESWQISDDKLTWTFKINDKATFSNGDKVTAEIVKASLERTFAKSVRARSFFTYEEIKADGQKLLIKTDKPVPTLPSMLADPLFIIINTNVKDRDYAKEGPICSGPYMVQSFSKAKTVMQANPHYWQGEVPFKTVNIVSVDDPSTRALALQSGEIDLAVTIAPGDLELFTGRDYHISQLASLRTTLGRMNMAEGRPLADWRVRSALISSLDRQTYNKVLLKDTFITGKAPVPPSLDYGFGQLTDHNTYNLERAKKLLAEAGWQDTDGDGYVDKNGKNLELELVYFSSRAELPLYAEATQADAKKAGIKIKLQNVDAGAMSEIGSRGEFDILLAGILTASSGDPEVYLNWYWKSDINGNNPQNVSSYSNPQFDALSDRLAVEFDPAKRRELIIQMQQLILDDSAAIFYGYSKTNMVSRSCLQNADVQPADYYWLTDSISFKNK